MGQREKKSPFKHFKKSNSFSVLKLCPYQEIRNEVSISNEVTDGANKKSKKKKMNLAVCKNGEIDL